jgi:hypothetical protein
LSGHGLPVLPPFPTFVTDAQIDLASGKRTSAFHGGDKIRGAKVYEHSEYGACFVVVAGMFGQPPAGGEPALPPMGGRGTLGRVGRVG